MENNLTNYPFFDINADYQNLINSTLPPFELKTIYSIDYIKQYLELNEDQFYKVFLILNQNLNSDKEFQNIKTTNPEYYNETDIAIVHKSIYTFFFIRDHINDSNWEEEIINYIDYVVCSFGRIVNYSKYSIGLNEYIELVKNSIQNTTINQNQKEVIINYCSNIYVRIQNEQNVYRIKEIYENWLKSVTNSYSLFPKLNELYEQGFIITSDKKKVNKHLEYELYDILTIDEVLNELNNITKKVISIINDKIDGFSFKELITIKEKENYNHNKLKFKLENIDKPKELKSEFDYWNLIQTWFNDFEDYLNLQINSKIPTHKDAFVYLNYKKNHLALESTFNVLSKNQKFIGDDVKLFSFKQIFNDNVQNGKISWTGSLLELNYFISQLYKKNIVEKSTSNRKWIITSNLFCLKNIATGVKTDISSMQLKGANKKNKNSEIIDKAIDYLL